jgi:hypothetical protein
VHKLIVPTIFAAGVLAAVAAHSSQPLEKGSQGKLTIAVFGDSPYGTSNADTSQFMATPAFINTINSDSDVSLVLQVGDIHSGQQICSYDYDLSIYKMWTGSPVPGAPLSPGFHSPVVYTPGDNEWTDCHKKNESGGGNGGNPNPLENLGYVRSIFFANPGHTIAVDKAVWSQSKNFDPKYPTDADYVENVMWEQSGIVFVTLNVPGGSNNDEDNWGNPSPPTQTKAQTDEILNRTGADLRWLDQAFTLAKDDHARAVVIQLQADMWDLDGKPPSHIGAYRQFIDSIALHTTDFGRNVLLLNGDSHRYRSDNPLLEGAPCVTEKEGDQSADLPCVDDAYGNQPNGYHVKNFHRIVVHGSTPKMEWLKLNVKPGDSEGREGPSSFGPFSWQRMIQLLP